MKILYLKNQKKKVKNFYKLCERKISLEYHSNFKILKKRSSNEIYSVLSGYVSDNFGNKVLTIGDIVKNETLKKLSKAFKIKKDILLLRLIS